MEVKEEKRPICGIDKYLHFIVLGLSGINLVQLTPQLIDSVNINEVCSVLLSFVGLLAFWLIQKKKNGGELIILLWSILQLINFINHPFYSIDLSQGFSLPIGMTFESSTNGVTTREVSLNINIIAGVLVSASFFRLKNKNTYKELLVRPKGIKNISEFTSKILKIYSFGKDKKMLILDYTSGLKSYAIQINKENKINFQNSEIEYLLCEIDTTRTKEESLKPYEFKQIGSVKITPSNR
jgi:hypothetical protein